ncbi:N-acetylmuramoyl-L-alanine amidase [Bradyrhizobium sp. CCH5-F6]|uniref:N-acetylmuramoyl-L-alanine amidase n=1 Tax=Bradyrhizobium sp. CCH5-F6 TaxID=1768753 RepID=UPI00076A75C8|nr:N-acetylmuramoyl-L-alanine amidase [Bradyrhizobium sp. CCH5-F6]
MTAISFIGKCFPTAKEFLDYLDTIQFKAWTPRFVTMHHTGGPSLATWKTYAHGNRKVPISDAQWMKNLAAYYGNELGWSAGPHFFFTPDNFCVLSLPEKRGVHAVSFNANSWGVECVGDFDSEPFTPDLANRYAEGLACLHVALGINPDPFVFNVRGLHFHRDDPKTTKTCPGRKVDKAVMAGLVKAKMLELTGAAAHDDDEPPPHVSPANRKGKVNVPPGDFLSVRDEPSAKSPETRRLQPGEAIEIIGDAMNGATRWYKIASPDGGDFVAARYVTLI